MNTQKNGKSPAGHIRKGFSGNYLNNCLDGNSKRLSVFDNNEIQENAQQVCVVCNPSNKNQDAAKLCAECTAKTETLSTMIFGQFSQNRKTVRLHQCSGCRRCVTPSKFSRDWGICKSCVADVQEKSKAARSNFIARTVNNFHKMLKGVAAL